MPIRRRCLRPLRVLALLATSAVAEQEWRPAPYEADAATLHLWHLDEPAAPFADAIDPPTPLRGLLNRARAGQPSLPGFGTALSFHHDAGGTPDQRTYRGALLLAAPALGDGPEDNVPADFALAGPDGAFTYEALVKLDVLPSEAPGMALSIVSMDGDREERVFNWRLEKGGFMGFIPINAVEAAGGAIAALPTTGPDAINTRDWFHAVVSYNGREGVSNNVSLYWTRLRPGLSEANLIGQGTMPADLPPIRGDFAIGNEARGSGTNEAAPFPGLIDEVRLSGKARHRSDFCFVPPDRRLAIEPAEAPPPPGAPISLQLLGLSVDGSTAKHPAPGKSLDLEPGLHRLDFEFRIAPGNLSAPPLVRWQLAGFDPTWEEHVQGMELRVEVVDETGAVISQAAFPAIGSSRGWETALDDSEFTRREEPLMLHSGARALRIILDSGTSATTGSFVIDDFDITHRPGNGEPVSLWFNQSFADGENMDTQTGTPVGWRRRGSDPSIARVHVRDLWNRGIGLVDGSQSAGASWIATAELPRTLAADTVVMVAWNEAHNVIGGNIRRASYLNVPSGSYMFRAIATTADGSSSTNLLLPIRIKAPFWTRPWYWGLVGTLAAALVAFAVLTYYRRRNRLRLRALRLQNALAEDRARIARDMHDDLGTRISVLTMSGAMAERHLDADPERARSHLVRMNTAARGIIAAMDDLVWSVNPANDGLAQFRTFLARTAKEVFSDTQVRWHLDLPTGLPDIPLRSELRHHLALTVKECCHNILRHAGPCEATLKLSFSDGLLAIEITDTGKGFDLAAPSDRNGLANMKRRMAEVGGGFEITSTPGAGTRVRLTSRP